MVQHEATTGPDANGLSTCGSSIAKHESLNDDGFGNTNHITIAGLTATDRGVGNAAYEDGDRSEAGLGANAVEKTDISPGGSVERKGVDVKHGSQHGSNLYRRPELKGRERSQSEVRALSSMNRFQAPPKPQRRAVSEQRPYTAVLRQDQAQKIGHDVRYLTPLKITPPPPTAEPNGPGQALSRQLEAKEPDSVGGNEQPNRAGHEPENENESLPEKIDMEQLWHEADSMWILNLSMQFRNESKREKLFITYAPKRNVWRRVNVVWDYANVRPGSLESDLQSMSLQRDKSVRVYDAIRLDLPRIQFKDSATQLRLKTEEDDKLHIYVDVDEEEVIDYPSIGVARDIDKRSCKRYRESQVLIDQHLSGFVYRVKVNDELMVKKEIPGPRQVDEFLYEMNGLYAVQDCASVVNLRGIVTDESSRCITAILVNYASKGSLSEILYDAAATGTKSSIPWARRVRWAGQVMAGLSAIHEAGFVQGDFTLGNIVIDADDNAHVIDMNRRGCPVGWEPPELLKLFHARQKINMMVSVKTDVYQLGMVLWAIAEQVDEPDCRDREELNTISSPDVPEWYQQIVGICLSERPQGRLAVGVLLQKFEKGMGNDHNDAHEDDDISSAYGEGRTPGPHDVTEGLGRGRLRLLPGRGREPRWMLDDVGRSVMEEGSVASARYSRASGAYNLQRQPTRSSIRSRSKASIVSYNQARPGRPASYISGRDEARQVPPPYRNEAHHATAFLHHDALDEVDEFGEGISRPLYHQDSGFDELLDGVDDANRYIILPSRSATTMGVGMGTPADRHDQAAHATSTIYVEGSSNRSAHDSGWEAGECP